MKRHLSVGLATLAMMVVGFVSQAEAQQLKIGFVDSDRILQESPAAAEIRATLETEFGPMRQEIEQMETRLQGQQDELRRAAATLSADVMQERQTALQQQYTAYQQRVQQIEQAFGQRQQQLVEPLMTRIRDILETVRREGNFSFIIDPPQGMVVSFDPQLDVTDRVLQRLAAR
jgi:outer membrane protein